MTGDMGWTDPDTPAFHRFQADRYPRDRMCCVADPVFVQRTSLTIATTPIFCSTVSLQDVESSHRRALLPQVAPSAVETDDQARSDGHRFPGWGAGSH